MALTKEDLQAISDLMDGKLEPIKTDLADVKRRVTKVELTQENEVLRSIRLLAEGHTDMADRLRGLDDLSEKVEDIQITVSVLKQGVKK